MKSFNYIVTGLLVVAVAYILIDNFYLDKRATQTGGASTVAEQTLTPESEAYKTIAVLPFADLSPERDQEYFVGGLTEEIINNLAKIPEFRVTSRTSSFEFRNTDKSIQEIASALGVKYILEGSVRKAGIAVRITAELIRSVDDLHLWSETYDRELRDIFALQENIATAVSNEIGVTLGIEKTISMGEADLIREVERIRIKALIEKNLEVARQLHADDFQFINPGGIVHTKEQYIEGLASDVFYYKKWDPGDIEVRMYGNAAAMRYQSQLQVVVMGQEAEATPHWHTNIYEKKDGSWRIVWSHASIIQ